MSKRLAKIIRSRSAATHKLDSEPGTVYEVITRQMVEDLGRELRDLRKRIDTLLFVVISAIIVDIAMRLTGAGS
jgi:hypothetical protein